MLETGHPGTRDQELPHATSMPLLDICSDTESGIKRTLGNFTGDTELSGAVHTLEGRGGIQRDLNRLEEGDM